MNITNYRSKSNNPLGSASSAIQQQSNIIGNNQFINRLPPQTKMSTNSQNQVAPQLMGIGNGIQPQAFNSNNLKQNNNVNNGIEFSSNIVGKNNFEYSRINNSNNNHLQPTASGINQKINANNDRNVGAMSQTASNSFQSAQIVGNSFIKQQILNNNNTIYPHHKKDQNSLSKINSSKEMPAKEHLSTAPDRTQSAAVQNANSNQIVIHVCDENKKMNKDFKCDRILLLNNMKYFEKYLADSKNLDDIDISVHCDINIFDWLMKYVHKKEPKLEIKNSVSILISSDFLQMAKLVEESVQFVVKNLQEIITLPIDMNCLNSSLIKKLARAITLHDLDNLKDKKDKLTSKLFMKKLEIIFEDEVNMLHRCVYCDQLYTSSQRDWMPCQKAKIFIDTHGTVIAQHVSDKTWDVNKFVMFLRQKTVPWKDIFMKIYARLQEFYCADCNYKFVGAEINHCSFHPMHPKFSFGSNNGIYPCCNSQAQRFSISLKKTGCTSKNHSIKVASPRKNHTSDNQNSFDLLMKHFQEVCEPYEFEKANVQTGKVEMMRKLTDCINSERSLMKFVKAFLQTRDQNEDQDEDEDCDDSSDEEADACQNLNSELQAQQQQTAALLSVKQKRKSKYKEWRMDTMRSDDFNQMKLMSKELQKLRKEDKVISKKSQRNAQAQEKQGGVGDTSQRPQTGNMNASSNQVRNRVQQHYSKARQNKIRR
eukprot:403361772